MDETISLVFEHIINFLQGIIFVVFCRSFLGAKYSKRVDLISAITTVVLMFVVISVQNYFVISFAYSEIILFCSVMLPYTIIFLKGKMYMRLAMPLFSYGICMGVSMGLSLFSAVIFGLQNTNIFGRQTFLYRIVMVVVVNLVDIFVYYMIYKIFRGKIKLKSSTDILFFVILPVITIAVLFLAYAMAIDETTTDLYRIFLGLISLAMFTVTVLVLNTMVKVTKNNELKMQNMIMKKEQEMYLSEIKNGSEYIREIAKIKHDMKNKMFCIGELLATNDIDEAKELCKDMSQELKNSAEAFNTDNVHLNSILNVSLRKAKSNGIDMMVNAQSLLKKIDGIDLITVIGNLCDNAIEALQKQKEKKLLLLFTQRSGYYIVVVKNYINESVLKKNPTLSSNKNNPILHGHGINNVRDVLKKYNGALRLYEEQDYFVVEAVFEIPSNTKN